jgi:methyltransferase (TIGR00027 family)
MSQIEDVSGTAFVVAEFRAMENQEPAPLYRDPVVGIFLDDDSRRAAEFIGARFPPSRDMVRVRTRYFDDQLDAQIRSHVRQVVILGAGLDTRAVRKPAPGVMYFEIDEAETLGLKNAAYQRRGIEPNVTFVPGNYVTDGVIDMLVRNGFELDQPTYVIWEGNLMYLPLDAIAETLVALRTHVEQVSVSCDYMAEAVIAKATGDPGVTALVEGFEAMGAPWVSGIADIGALVRDVGLNLVEDFTTRELYGGYGVRPMPSPIFDFYSICTLES